MSDQELIDKYLDSQQQNYFGELYDRYADKVYGKCLSILKDQALAEDAAQDVFTKIFLRLASFNGKSKFSTWIYSITYNYCIDLIRKNKKHKYILSVDQENVPEVADKVEVSDAEFLEMEIERLSKILDEISPEDKAILILKYQDGVSIKEISKIVNKSESAVKMQLKRAKAKVRKHHDSLFLLFVIASTWFLRK
ncbi:MAG: sigma-70 family RNA polymerase sigma factor [Aureispira sp.]|nr:sigma-70 family RNA polymerase sigma factor [Aureispira sp.]